MGPLKAVHLDQVLVNLKADQKDFVMVGQRVALTVYFSAGMMVAL